MIFLVAMAIGAKISAQELLLDTLSARTEIGGEIQSRQFQDWTVTCSRVASSDLAHCKMIQELYTDDNTNLLLSLSGEERHETDGKSSTVFMLVLPLGILLPEAVEIKVDGGPARQLAVRSCHIGGCLAPFVLTPDLKREFQNSRSLAISFKSVDGVTVSTKISLIGFTTSLQTISTIE